MCASCRSLDSPMMAGFDRGRILRIATNLIEVAYPPRCAGCGLRGRWVCDECLKRTPLFADPRCQICSLPSTGAACDCRELPDRIDQLWIAAPYDGWVRSAIHSYKFAGETARAPHFATLLAAACDSMGAGAASCKTQTAARLRTDLDIGSRDRKAHRSTGLHWASEGT